MLKPRRPLRDNKLPLIVLCAALFALVLFGLVIFSDDEKPKKDPQIAILQNQLKGLENRIVVIEETLARDQENIRKIEADIPLITAQIQAQLEEFQKKLTSEKPKRVTSRPVTTAKNVPSASSKKKVAAKTGRKPVKKADNRYHIVKSGETLFQIGRMFGISVEKLKEINHLTSGMIRTGQKLKVSP